MFDVLVRFSWVPDTASHARTDRKQASVHRYSLLPLGHRNSYTWRVDSFGVLEIHLDLGHGQ